ncbi:MAG TPA: peptidylprolyl isomerase [Dehalococcoidia bacterium]|nr:peptidylprolyl isomerase [Dehalococcoidia bacterium]
MQTSFRVWGLGAFLLLALAVTAACETPPAAPAKTPTPAAKATPAKSSPTPEATKPAQGGATVPKQYSSPPAMAIDQNKSYTATLHTTLGDMKIELFAKEAPKTVNNFVFLSREGFYSNVKFHRIIKGFMAQTGDPLGTGAGGPGYRFEDEPVTRNYDRGIVAMANAGKNTNGSQFFIMHANYGLQKNYTIFGLVTDQAGLETLDKIANTPVRPSPQGEMSVPTQEVRITSIDITEK